MFVGAGQELEQSAIDGHAGIVGLDACVNIRLTWLSANDPAVPSETRTRLVVEAPRRVSVSVLPSEDPARAEEVSLETGIPEHVLRRNDAVVRQTHRRAGVVVLDVPEDRQSALRRDLEAAGFEARPPKLVHALLNESVPGLHVPPVWRAGVEGSGIRVGIVDTGADRHPDFAVRIVAYRDFTESGAADEVGHGTHVAGIVGAGTVFRGVAPKASLVIAKALSLCAAERRTRYWPRSRG
jgi:subtilisin family serine protease